MTILDDVNITYHTSTTRVYAFPTWGYNEITKSNLDSPHIVTVS